MSSSFRSDAANAKLFPRLLGKNGKMWLSKIKPIEHEGGDFLC